MSEVVVRRAVPAEYGTVGELTVAAYRALPVDHLWGGYEAEILAVDERAELTEVLVAADGERILGAVTYATEPDSGWLEWTESGEAQFRLLAVALEARGRGIGELLARACMDRAASDGLRICIHTTRWMEAAQRLYPRLGFVRSPERDATYADWGGPSIDDLPPIWVDESFMAFTWPG